MCVESTGRSYKMTTYAWLSCIFVALLCSTTIQASKSNLIVDIEPKRQTAVRLGESLQILCRVGRPLQVCRVEIPGEEGGMVLTKGQPPEDGIEYYGEGTEAGQCGVRIAKIRETHDGLFKCTLTPTDSRAEAQASVRIIVAKPPNSPELQTNPGSYGRNTYRKGEKLEVSCNAPGGRPAANVSLFLDDEPISNDERTTIYDSNIDDYSLAVQNASRTLDWTDNGKVLRCVASHIALDRPKETTMQLQVYYPPQPQPAIGRFGYVIGREGIVNVTVFANPRPHFLWRVNDEKINEGRPDESNRIQTSTAVDLGRGAWSVILTIDSVQKSDTEKEYILEARNDEGAYEYRIILSTSTEPTGVDLDAGSIIGIVVGVLVLLLVVFLLIFARATGRWCFAARRRGDEEAAGGVGAGSEAHITPGDEDDEEHEDPRIIDEKIPQGGQENPIHASTESDTESAGRYSRTEVDGTSARRERKPRISLTQLFRRNKDKVSGADTDTMRTVVTIDDEKVQTTESAAQENRPNPVAGEGGIVYAELDLTQQQQSTTPRQLNDDKTEYAEILYTKPPEAADK